MEKNTLGSNIFIDARDNVKNSFIYAIIAFAFSILSINYYQSAYKMQFVFTHLANADGQVYTSPFVDMLWWINLFNLIATLSLIAVVIFCRFKWANRFWMLIPAGVKLVCVCAQVFIIYTRNFASISANPVYDFKGTLLIFSLVYIAAFVLLVACVALPGQTGKVFGIASLVLCAVVTIAAFFFPTPYSFVYKLFGADKEFAYRALNAQVADILFIMSAMLISNGLSVYHRLLKEDAEAIKNADY